jgi:hypothetical protein
LSGTVFGQSVLRNQTFQNMGYTMKEIKLLGVVVGIFISSVGFSQNSYFDVMLAGRNVGSLRVFSDDVKSDAETHRIESDFKFLFYSGRYTIQSQYAQGKLLHADASHHVNGDLKERTQTKRSDSPMYQVLFSGEDAPKSDKKELNHPIRNTITGLYYKEPVNVSEVYSERYGLMCSVKKLSEGLYGVALPGGKQGIYTYRNGQCRVVEQDLAGFKLRIVRNDSKSVSR